jgi:hypothetical protein
MYLVCIIVQIHQLFIKSKKYTFAYICGRSDYIFQSIGVCIPWGKKKEEKFLKKKTAS